MRRSDGKLKPTAGAHPWFYTVPYQSDVKKAMLELRERVSGGPVQSRRCFPGHVRRRRAWGGDLLRRLFVRLTGGSALHLFRSAVEVSCAPLPPYWSFDPRDFVDLSSIPHKPKVQRPLSRAAADRILATFDGAVAEYVWYDESGYVGCSWSQAPRRLWDKIYRFALAVAEGENAVVMNEPPNWIIEYPETARKAQEKLCASRCPITPGGPRDGSELPAHRALRADRQHAHGGAGGDGRLH